MALPSTPLAMLTNDMSPVDDMVDVVMTEGEDVEKPHVRFGFKTLATMHLAVCAVTFLVTSMMTGGAVYRIVRNCIKS